MVRHRIRPRSRVVLVVTLVHPCEVPGASIMAVTAPQRSNIGTRQPAFDLGIVPGRPSAVVFILGGCDRIFVRIDVEVRTSCD
jgi:hypothetical protein